MGVSAPTPLSRVYPDHHTRSAPSPEALGPARRVDAPLRCAGPQGHTTWLGVGRPGSTGGSVVPSRRARTPSRRRRAAIRRLDGRRFSGAQAWPAPVAPCAHPFARRPRCWWRVSTQSASPHRSPVCTDVDGEEVAGSHAWAAWSGSVLSSCSLCDAVERRVGVRGQKQRAWLCRAGRRRGQIWGVLGACRGVAGDVPGRWPGRRHARITQGRHVGELEPELYFLGVGS